MQHQKSNFTEFNRYPLIFQNCKRLICKKRIKILSFCCSTCEEILTLKKIYFPMSEIYGVDIDEENLKKCASKIDSKFIINYENFLQDKKEFDIIFAMSCFCRWDDTEKVNDSTSIYPFSNFESGVNLLDSKLRKNGYLVIYNSNYIFEDCLIFKKYQKMICTEIKESGHVHKFDKFNKKIKTNYDGVIFKKIVSDN